MQFSIKTVALLSTIYFGSLTSAQTIAFGQELQNEDQTNHWVTWVNGQHACPGQQVLGVLTQPACGQSFQLGEVEYEFTGCIDNGPPTAILDSSGIQIGACSSAGGKIHCSGSDHDIIKHGECTIQNNSRVKRFSA